MNILLNDKKHAFGHGYCLGMALLNIDYTVISLFSNGMNSWSIV